MSYFAELPADDQAVLAELAAKYLPLVPGADPEAPIQNAETCWEVIQWQRIETEVLEAHGQWLSKIKAIVERSGREWNRENFLRYCRLRECE